MLFNVFDRIVYINLDHRTDRNESLLKEMGRLSVDTNRLHRISACNDPLNGVRGCLQSHIEALKTIEKMGGERGLILEDDCIFNETIDEKAIEGFFESVKEDWDVFFLGGLYKERESTKWESIQRIRRSFHAHAYCVNKHYLSTLLCCFEEAYEEIKNDLFFLYSLRGSVDHSWQKLQKKDRWFALNEAVAFQKIAFSDIDYCEKSKYRR